MISEMRVFLSGEIIVLLTCYYTRIRHHCGRLAAAFATVVG